MKKRKFLIGIISIALLVQLTAAPVLAVPVSEKEETISEENAIAVLAVTNGFGQDADGSWYYYVNGQIDTGCNTVIHDTEKQIDNTASWWYVVGGKVQKDFTGLANYSNENGWWYIKDGKVDFTHNGVDKNANGWWYVTGGQVQFGFTGLANYSNENGWWYIKDGKVDFTHNGVDKNNNGWWYVTDGQVQFGFTGLANYKNENGWWYIKDGAVDFTHNGVDKNVNGWWYVTGGQVQFGFTGLANYSNENGWWYIKDGAVDFDHNGVDKNNNGWWYVTGGQVQFGFTGLANYSNENGWWYIKGGAVDFNHNGVDKNNNGWWYVTGGQVQFGFTGLANYSNENGWWYIKNGQVDFSVNTVAQNNNGWWYVTGGQVDFSFNGIAKNENGWWYISGGKVDFGYNGTVTVSAGSYSVENGKVKNVNASGIASSSMIPVAEWDEAAYAVSEEYIQYGGTDTAQLAAPKFTGSVSDSGMTLTWNAVPGAEKYRVFRRKNGGDWQKIADTTKTTYLDNLWTETTLYQYTVRCINSAGTAYTSPYIAGYSGSALAEFGQQFVGDPYVYGGNSLTDGCDCSGFVMQVYANFGYYLPRYSGNQITLGKEVSDSDAQPGDIAGRTGHVVLCIGDGKVVQAKGAAYGICITKLSEVTYSTVRRIL